MFIKAFGKVVCDNDFVVIDDHFTDEYLDDGFSDLHALNVAAEHRVQIVFDDLRSEVGIGTLLFLFDIKIGLGNL